MRRRQSGFTYLGVLLAIALLGVGLLAASEVWVSAADRQKNEELQWIGSQFTLAIGSFYEASPGTTKRYPVSLDELLNDRRHATVRRHLRMLYLNPFTGKADWELVKAADGQVRGVRAIILTNGRTVSRVFVYVPPAL